MLKLTNLPLGPRDYGVSRIVPQHVIDDSGIGFDDLLMLDCVIRRQGQLLLNGGKIGTGQKISNETDTVASVNAREVANALKVG